MKLGLEIQRRLVPACAKISNGWSILADSSVQTCTIMAKRRTSPTFLIVKADSE